MVQKKGKYGIETGNTLRAINTKYIRRYRREAYIVRRDTAVRLKSHLDLSTDVFEGCEDVFYSLHKKQRWLLPDLIHGLIEEYRHEFVYWTSYIEQQNELRIEDRAGLDEENLWPPNLELVERCKLARNNNCRSIHTFKIESKGDRKVCKKIDKFKKSQFIDADNVLKTAPLFSRHTSRLRFLREYYDTEGSAPDVEIPDTNNKRSEKPIEQNDNPKADPLRLEVLYPCEYSSVLSIKPKVIGNETKKKFECRNYIRNPWKLEGYEFRRRPQKNKRENFYEVIKEGLDAFYDEEEYIDTEEEIEQTDTSPMRKRSGKKSAEIKVRTTQIKPDTKDSRNNIKEKVNDEAADSEKKEKDEYGYPVQDESSAVQCGTEADHDENKNSYANRIESATVSVLLRKDEVDVKALEDHYGYDYTECDCIPRRFVLSISEYINDLDLDGIGSAYKLLSILNKKTFSWLVFSHDVTNKRNSLSEEAFHVSLNSHFKGLSTVIRIEGISDHSVVSITEIIDKTLKSLRVLPRDTLIFEKKSGNINLLETKKQSLLEEMKNWTNSTYLPDNSYVINTLINPKESSLKENSSPIQTDETVKQTKFCNVCSHAKTDIFALKLCRHYFCETCWKSYIEIKVRTGCDVIHCPEVNCDVIIDNGMVLSFLSVNDILIYAKRRHNISVEKNKLARWCSSESCGRVIQVNKIGVRTTTCMCGETMCFSCAGKPHWPLTCEQYQEYVNILVKTRDKNITPHDFVLKFDKKFCRICFKHLANYEKCYLENCVCEGMSCSRCSFLLHIQNPAFNSHIREVSLSQELSAASSVDLHRQRSFLSGGVRTQWYKLALKHRLNQHPFRLAKLQANSKLLTKRLGHYILREEKKCHFIYLDILANEDSYMREADKVALFTTQIVNFYGEINNIIENCSFFLNKENSSAGGKRDSLHRRAMVLSTCATTICNMMKDGAFLNPKVVIESLTETFTEIKRVMESIVKDF